MESEGSLPHSQEPPSCRYPETGKSSPCPLPSPFLNIRFNIIRHLRLGLPSGLIPSDFPTKSLYAPLLLPICAACPAYLIIFDSKCNNIFAVIIIIIIIKSVLVVLLSDSVTWWPVIALIHEYN
jgi:hypothetical protein